MASPETDDHEIRVEIRGLMLDPASNLPIVILREEGGQRLLPIWIGVFEANAIALRIDGFEPPRPMTHDLLFATFGALGASVAKIVISDLRDTTFYAQIHFQRGGETEAILDARPSDALALALRAEAPIFVCRSVLDKAQATDRATEASNDEQLRKWLEEVSPEDLGKYTM